MSGSIPSWVRVGAKAVYLGRDPSRPHSIFNRLLVAGAVYTIREVFLSPAESAFGCRVEEVVNPVHPAWGLEGGYYLDRFRPLITKSQEQDVGLFVHHLNDARVTERA